MFQRSDYLVLTQDEDTCASHTGKLGGEQPIILGKGCESFGHAAHELGHALGLYHTMSRYDRNEFIKIFFENLQLPNFSSHQATSSCFYLKKKII
ncbi:unnamed protein product [Strongylus vulgaris]|uniref:Metalloendopeptidase n=1 Tax=Strongylus vulgaris TaxID=40348 RepID=A0A3P7JA62_STRVU|nr:unnamed protein product [Strongylus vulgaris]